MKKNLKKFTMFLLAALLATGFMLVSCDDINYGLADDALSARATTITSNQTGTQDGYDYELWKDNGNVSMTLENGGNFSCQWSNIGNMLCRKGRKLGASQTYSQIGDITIKYDAQFTPGGNSYLCVYGWSKDPLVEYYIIESYGTYKPTGTSKGSISVDGGTYELYETTRNNEPSIEGTKTFKQFWSVRTSKRTSGTVTVSEHFKQWANKGMTLGKIYEVALTVEGYQSSGNAKITSHYLTIGGNSSSNNNNNNNNSSGGTVTSTTTSSGATKIEAENMIKGGQYTGNCSSPFTGVTLYANDDKVSFSQSFSGNSHTFKVRGASNNNNEAQVQLKIGGTSYGTYKFKGTSPSEQSITATHNQSGKTATVELVCVNDNDTWDAFIDWIEISASSGGTTNTNTTTNTTTTTTTSSGATKIEAENMTKGGKYTGNCSSPFNGVTLYANDDKVSFSQSFSGNSHTFKVRGASNNNNEAQVQLKIGGTSYGTYKFKGTSPSEQSITATHNQNGKTATVELVCVNDNDTWDAFIDWIEISASSSGTSSTTTSSGSTTTSGTKYTFSQLSFASQYSISSYNVSNGSLNVTYSKQYAEIKYNLPSNISLSNISSIVVNGSSPNGQTAVKFYDTNGNEAFVMYNNKGSTADWTKSLSSAEKGKTIKTIGIMSQDSSSYSATINSITFK